MVFRVFLHIPFLLVLALLVQVLMTIKALLGNGIFILVLVFVLIINLIIFIKVGLLAMNVPGDILLFDFCRVDRIHIANELQLQ
ncbi:hypothetical protein D3C73_1553780 [compost metagenome]